MYLVQQVQNDVVVSVVPRLYSRADALEYCAVAAKAGQEYRMTKAEINVDCVGVKPKQVISFSSKRYRYLHGLFSNG